MIRQSAVAAIALLALTGCSTQAKAPATPKPALYVHGTIGVRPSTFLQNGHIFANGDSCTASDGFSDVHSGAQVVITDAASKTIAVGTLEPGSILIADGDAPIQGRCTFPFDVQDVPPGSKFYGVHVGNTNRGNLQYTAAQLRKGVALTLG